MFSMAIAMFTRCAKLIGVSLSEPHEVALPPFLLPGPPSRKSCVNPGNRAMLRISEVDECHYMYPL